MDHDEIQEGFVIHGRVQGVGFRWWCRSTAADLGVRGTVRNRSDGAVEIHAAGPPRAVRELARRLEHGPSPAEVRRIEKIDSERSLPEGFEIAR